MCESLVQKHFTWVACAAISGVLALCGSSAVAQCGNPGNCFAAHGTPGCSNPTCCNTVCAVDPFCCSDVWDNVCVAEALDLCTPCGEAGAGGCYESHTGTGCDNLSCCDFVCEIDPFCCTSGWDDICAGEAIDLCSTCGEPNAGSCLQAHSTPGCQSEGCCSYVCEIDPFCCSTVWDGTCVSEAFEFCTSCGSPFSESCFVEHSSRSCDNYTCCYYVCTVDPYCCEIVWDSICVSEAEAICATCGGAGAGPCFFPSATPSCNDADCCNAVCIEDPFCCQGNWDALCVKESLFICYGSGRPEAGDCYEPNGSPGCNSLSCSALVCAIYPYCCTTEWEDWCADLASQLCCPQDCVSSTTFTWPNDGKVDGADLAVLLTSWGKCRECCADTVNSAFQPVPDGVVNGADLGVLLTSWGNPGCPN